MKTLTALAVWCGLAAGSGWAAAQQPVTLTTTTEFKRGNNEGLIAVDQDRITRDRIDAGSLGGWSGTTSLPAGRNLPRSVIYNGFMYVLGGYEPGTNDASSVVRVAPLNADGSVGDWSSTTDLPASGHILFSAAAYNGFLYVIGGCDSAYNGYDDVFVAPINQDGTLGDWASTTPLSNTRTYHTSVAHNGYLYVIAGVDAGGYTGNISVAQIQPDGTVGDWTSTTALPSPLVYHSAVVFNDFLYVVGGFDSEAGSIVSDVVVAPLNPDGSVGAWSACAALPVPLAMHSVVAHGGFAYAIGGFDDGFNLRDDVFAAAFNADGSIGPWTSTTALPATRGRHCAVAEAGYLYVLAGTDAAYSFFTDVLVAPITADPGNLNQTPNRLRGYYSHLVDMQGESSTVWIILNGQLSSGGVVRLQVRTASESSGIFGSEAVIDSASLGTPIEITGTARYVWIRLTLDDTGTSNVDQPTYISDLTIAPALPPLGGSVQDGVGDDIDSQTSTSKIEAHWSGFTTVGGDSIESYEWAIGTAPGLTNVQSWVNVGPATSASNTSLSLGFGMKFVSVRAISSNGLTSAVATSDGVQVLAATAPTGGGGGHSSSRCGQSAGDGGSATALIGALVFAAGLFGRRRARR